jgi:hypothetical protein
MVLFNLPKHTMPVQDLKDQVVATNPSTDPQSQDLNYIGALHDYPLHLRQTVCPDDMYRELQRLHANAIKKKIPALGTTTMPKSPTANYSANGRYAMRLEDARAPEPVQNSQQDPSVPGSVKPGMQRWYIERAHVQPWIPVRGEGAAAHDGHSEK